MARGGGCRTPLGKAELGGKGAQLPGGGGRDGRGGTSTAAYPGGSFGCSWLDRGEGVGWVTDPNPGGLQRSPGGPGGRVGLLGFVQVTGCADRSTQGVWLGEGVSQASHLPPPVSRDASPPRTLSHRGSGSPVLRSEDLSRGRRGSWGGGRARVCMGGHTRSSLPSSQKQLWSLERRKWGRIWGVGSTREETSLPLRVCLHGFHAHRSGGGGGRRQRC